MAYYAHLDIHTHTRASRRRARYNGAPTRSDRDADDAEDGGGDA